MARIAERSQLSPSEYLAWEREQELKHEYFEGEVYRQLPSLTDYILVSQERAQIEHFARAVDGRWIYSVAESGGRVRLTDGTDLDVDPIFDGVFALPGG